VSHVSQRPLLGFCVKHPGQICASGSPAAPPVPAPVPGAYPGKGMTSPLAGCA
jgi:hypothetical protein